MSYLEKAKKWEARKKVEGNKSRQEYMDERFQAMLSEVKSIPLDDEYLEYHEPENRAAISRAEHKLGAAWARALAGDESAKADFDQALEVLRQAFLKSVREYKYFCAGGSD